VVVADPLGYCHDTCVLQYVLFFGVASPALHDFAGDIQSLRVVRSGTSPRQFAATSPQKNLFYSYGVCLISLNVFTNMNTLSATCSRNRILLPEGMLPKL
jgi:hypothetical protein